MFSSQVVSSVNGVSTNAADMRRNEGYNGSSDSHGDISDDDIPQAPAVEVPTTHRYNIRSKTREPVVAQVVSQEDSEVSSASLHNPDGDYTSSDVSAQACRVYARPHYTKSHGIYRSKECIDARDLIVRGLKDAKDMKYMRQSFESFLSPMPIVYKRDQQPCRKYFQDNSLILRLGELYEKRCSDIVVPQTEKQMLSEQMDPLVCLATAMADENEFESQINLRTFKYAVAEDDEKVLRSGWIQKVKGNQSGMFKSLKSRAYIQGQTLKAGEDFDNSYSPVSDQEAIRIAIAVAVIYSLQIFQLDLTTAYLQVSISKLRKKVLMTQYPGFELRNSDGTILKSSNGKRICLQLVQSLYGLPTSSWELHTRLTESLRELGFEQCDHNGCVFKSGKLGQSTFKLAIIYVDDIILVCPGAKEADAFAEQLGKGWLHSGIHPANWFLRMKLSKFVGGYSLSIERAIDEMLEKYNFEHANGVTTPGDANLVLSKDDYLQDSKEDQEKWPRYRFNI